MEVTKTLMLDIAALSQSLEAGIGEYLRPEQAGWYLPYELEPVLKEGRAYYVTEVARGLVKLDIGTAPLPKVDIYDKHADIVVRAEQIKALQPRAHPHSARVIDLLKAYANQLLDSHIAWGDRRVERHIDDVIRPFVYPQYEENDEILSMIGDHLLDFRTNIIDFLGKDKWIMHFLKVARGSLVIEKTVDYRIYSWMIEHGYTDRPA